MSTKRGVGVQEAAVPASDLAATLPGGTDDGTGLAAALVAARELLISTVDAINPGTPARDLLACLARYRAHLATVVAVCPVPYGGDRA